MGNIKKFEDFLDKMRGLLDNAKKQGHIIVRVEDIENTFPELKESESEDERVRKKLIDLIYKVYANTSYITCVEHEDMLAWLEKQGEQNLIMAKSPQLGEQKPFDYEDANIQQKDFAPKSAMEAAKEKKIDNANKVEPKDYNSIDPHFGKPADKA